MILLKYFFHREYYVNLKNSNIFLLEQPTTLSNVLKMRNNQFLTQLSASNSWNTYVHRDNRYKHARMAPDWWQIARFDHESVKLVSIRQFSASFRMKKKKKNKKKSSLVRERTCETSKSSRKRRKEYWSALNLHYPARISPLVHPRDFNGVHICTLLYNLRRGSANMSVTRRSSSSPEVRAEIHTISRVTFP